MNSHDEVKRALAIVEASNALKSLRRTLEALKPEQRAEVFEERLKNLPLAGDCKKLEKEYRKILGDLLSRQVIRLCIDRALRDREGVADREEPEDPITVFEAAMNEGGLTLETGINKIDMAFGGGIRPRECLSIVAAEGSGKTSFLLGMLDRYARAGGRCLHFNLDMADSKFIEKHLAMLMRVLPRKVDEERRENTSRYRDAVRAIRGNPNFRVLHGPRTLADMEAEILDFNPQVVSIDYLTAVEGDFKNDYDVVKGTIKAIRRWRNNWGTSFVLLSQMGRGSKSDVSKGGSGSHALGGGDVERFVDCEIELMQDLRPEDLSEKRYIATITKNRSGTSRQSFELDFKVDGLYFGPNSWKVEADAAPKVIFKSTTGFSLKEQAAEEKKVRDAERERKKKAVEDKKARGEPVGNIEDLLGEPLEVKNNDPRSRTPEEKIQANIDQKGHDCIVSVSSVCRAAVNDQKLVQKFLAKLADDGLLEFLDNGEGGNNPTYKKVPPPSYTDILKGGADDAAV